jgi:riboflavin kinase / FMN adenylyltransferase
LLVLTWEELVSGRDTEPIAAVVGVFDGLHIGHRELVSKVTGKEGLRSTVITFKENPKRILSPTSFVGVLSTMDQKLSLIESMGVDLCALIDFSGDFSKLPGRQFLSMLRDGGGLRYLAVGADFRCGHRLDTDTGDISQFCAESSIGVDVLSAVQWAGRPVSSSRIRKSVLDGRLEDATSMLGRPYEIDFRGANHPGSGRLLPTGGQASPPAGTYECSLSYLDDSRGAERTEEMPRFEARLEADGSWSIPVMGLRPTRGSGPVGLRLISKVSIE